MVSRKGIIEGMDWRAVAAQHGLPDPVEVDDSRGHGIILFPLTIEPQLV